MDTTGETVESDPQTREPILLEIKRGPRGRFISSPARSRDWRSYLGPVRPFWALGPGQPLRGMALGFVLCMLTVAATDRISDPRLLIPGYFLAIVVLLVPMFVEKARQRDFVTPTRLVHQYGLLGRVRKEIPLSTVERVEVDYSRYWPVGESWDIGDLHIHSPGAVTTLASVPQPNVIAQAIVAIKNGKYPEPQ